MVVSVLPCLPFCPWLREVRVFSWFSWLKVSKGVGHEPHERARKDKGTFATEYAEGADIRLKETKVGRSGVSVLSCFPFCPWLTKVRVFSWFSWLKVSKSVGHETHERARKRQRRCLPRNTPKARTKPSPGKVGRMVVSVFSCLPFCPRLREVRVFSWLIGSKRP